MLGLIKFGKDPFVRSMSGWSGLGWGLRCCVGPSVLLVHLGSGRVFVCGSGVVVRRGVWWVGVLAGGFV